MDGFQVRGEESSRIAGCLVKVHVTDKKDECAQFLYLPYVAVVWMEGKAGDPVIQVRFYSYTNNQTTNLNNNPLFRK
jgi:hypothetical protein